jgi:hypothetical protein
MTASQESPVNSDIAASQTDSRSNVAPQRTQARGESAAEQLTETTAGAGRQIAAVKVQRGQSTAAGQRQQKTARPGHHQRPVDGFRAGACIEDDPAGQHHHGREQDRRRTEEAVRHIGKPGADRTDLVAQWCAITGMTEARIQSTVTEQGHQHDERNGTKHPQRGLAHDARERRSDAAVLESDCPGRARSHCLTRS